MHVQWLCSLLQTCARVHPTRLLSVRQPFNVELIRCFGLGSWVQGASYRRHLKSLETQTTRILDGLYGHFIRQTYFEPVPNDARYRRDDIYGSNEHNFREQICRRFRVFIVCDFLRNTQHLVQYDHLGAPILGKCKLPFLLDHCDGRVYHSDVHLDLHGHWF